MEAYKQRCLWRRFKQLSYGGNKSGGWPKKNKISWVALLPKQVYHKIRPKDAYGGERDTQLRVNTADTIDSLSSFKTFLLRMKMMLFLGPQSAI
mmetsp:Transcript_24193/g.29331  ORF Transcript_24193/g.29331 Transcript_24193/m.29331 type:complete len:94 (+) Transcript_24193:411-692(+)